jgi:hypothetical protein
VVVRWVCSSFPEFCDFLVSWGVLLPCQDCTLDEGGWVVFLELEALWCLACGMEETLILGGKWTTLCDVRTNLLGKLVKRCFFWNFSSVHLGFRMRLS